MGMWRSHEHCERLSGEGLVVGVAPPSANEPQVLKARHRPADMAVARSAGAFGRMIH